MRPRILLPIVDDASQIDAAAAARTRPRAIAGVLGTMIETVAAVERVAEIAARCPPRRRDARSPAKAVPPGGTVRRKSAPTSR